MEATGTQTKWKIDPAHSEILFKVKHLMITNVKGEFRKFEAEIISDGDDFSDAKINAVIDSSSIFTNNEDRDTHLKSDDFFDIENYPELRFESTEVNKLDAENYQLKGNLTIRGESREVSLDVELGGIIKDPNGNEKAGFSLSGKINRKDWGLNYNAALETGGVMVGNEIKLSAEAQFIKQG